MTVIEPVKGLREDPTESLELLRQKVLGALAAIVDPRFTSYIDVITQPPTYVSYQNHIQGLHHFFRSEFNEAIQSFEKAYQVDQDFAQPYIFAAVANLNLHEYSKAEKLMK